MSLLTHHISCFSIFHNYIYLSVREIYATLLTLLLSINMTDLLYLLIIKSHCILLFCIVWQHSTYCRPLHTVDRYTPHTMYCLTHMYCTYGTLYSLCTFPVSHVEVSSSTSVHHSFSISSHTYYYLLSAHCCGLSLTTLSTVYHHTHLVGATIVLIIVIVIIFLFRWEHKKNTLMYG